MASAVSTGTISLTIANEKTGEPVTYKQDGKRFTHDVTLKLSVNTSYLISVILKPEFSTLNKLELGSDLLSPGESVSSEGTKKHTFLWNTTGLSPSGSAKRNSLLLTFHFSSGVVTHTLQTKFYKSGDTQHVSWGSSLHSVDLSCRLEPDGSSAGRITDCRIR